MPRTKPDGPTHDWEALYDAAVPQAGYFTLADALAAGFSAPLLSYHSGKRVERISRGIYRLRPYPYGMEDEYVPLWLWTNKTGVYSHETALQMHGLSDALPARHHMTVPEAWRNRRLRVPKPLSLHYGDLASTDRTWHGPVPVTTPLRTFLDCAMSSVAPDLLADARNAAIARGLVSRDELDAVIGGLK